MPGGRGQTNDEGFWDADFMDALVMLDDEEVDRLVGRC